MEFQPENEVWGGLGLSEEPPGCCSREGAAVLSLHKGPVKPFPGKIPPDLVSEECQKKAGGEKEPGWVFYPSTAPWELPAWRRWKTTPGTGWKTTLRS